MVQVAETPVSEVPATEAGNQVPTSPEAVNGNTAAPKKAARRAAKAAGKPAKAATVKNKPAVVSTNGKPAKGKGKAKGKPVKGKGKKVVKKEAKERAKKEGLRTHQLRVLKALEKGPLTMNDLVKVTKLAQQTLWLGIGPADASKNAAHEEKQGFPSLLGSKLILLKEDEDSDGAKTRVYHLTAKGAKEAGKVVEKLPQPKGLWKKLKGSGKGKK